MVQCNFIARSYIYTVIVTDPLMLAHKRKLMFASQLASIIVSPRILKDVLTLYILQYLLAAQENYRTNVYPGSFSQAVVN